MFWPFKICPIETVYVYVDAEQAYHTCSELSIIRLLFVGNQLLLVAKLKRQRHILITTMSVIPSKMWRWKYSSKMPCDFLQLSFQIAHIFFAVHVPSYIVSSLYFFARHGSRCSSWFTIAVLLSCWNPFRKTISVYGSCNKWSHLWLTFVFVRQDTRITKIASICFIVSI